MKYSQDPTSQKKINMFQEIFVESNSARLDEYVFCMNRNLSNSSIEKLYLVVCENDYEINRSYFDDLLDNKLIQNGKVQLLKNSNKRFTFNKLLDYSKELLPEDSIVLTANLDIFIPDIDEWKNIYNDFFKATDKKICLALARTEYVNDNLTFTDEIAWNNGEFCDCWCFTTPLQITHEDFPYEVPVGFAPTCDNHMFIILGKKYDKVFNWAEKYRIYHFDIARKPDVIKTRRGRMIINQNTYKLPDQNHPFLKENRNLLHLVPRSNWQLVLDNLNKK